MNQLPFTSVNYGADTTHEGRIIIKAMLEGSIKGVGKFGRTPIFPCGIFQLKDGINTKKGDPNYDLFELAIKSTIKRLYPNYANLDWTNQQDWVKQDRDMKRKVISALCPEIKTEAVKFFKDNPKFAEKMCLKVINNELVVDDVERPTEIFSTMGCRTVNGADVNYDEDYYFNQLISCTDGSTSLEDLDKDLLSKAQKDGRGNICPCTIILPTVAMETKKRLPSDVDESTLIKEFFNDLNKYIDLAKDGLLSRYEYIAKQDIKAATFVWENHTMEGYVPGEGIDSYIRHGTIVIGQLGLAETLQLLIHTNQLTDKGMKLAKQIEQVYRTKCDEFKKIYHMNFGVYFTPAENTCYTAMKKFKAKYGVIPNVSDREYFTNSMHVPVWEKIDPYKKIDVESQLTGYSNAGCITYIEIGDSCLHNEKALKQFVLYAKKKDIPYFAINLPNDMCEKCGYQGEIKEGEACPCCGEKENISRLKRITGYLNGNYTTSFNLGKRAEARDRVKHTDYLSIGEI